MCGLSMRGVYRSREVHYEALSSCRVAALIVESIFHSAIGRWSGVRLRAQALFLFSDLRFIQMFLFTAALMLIIAASQFEVAIDAYVIHSELESKMFSANG